MTPLALATLVRKKTRTDTTTYADAEMLVDANLMKDDMAGKIAAQRNEAFNIQKLENLVADTRAYEYDDNVMNKLERVEIMFAASADYVVVTMAKHYHYRKGTQESEITDNYSNEAPVGFIQGKFFHILSGTIISVTNGIRWIYKEFPENFANLTESSTDMLAWANSTTPGFPREFHELLARRIGIEWKSRKERVMSQLELNFDRDFQTAMDNYMVVSSDEELIGTLPNPSTRGNSGFDY